MLQEARIFHAAQTDPGKCQQVLTRLLYLLTQGESFTKNEATEVLCTKLFQNYDANLRRLVYLIIKEPPPGATRSSSPPRS